MPYQLAWVGSHSPTPPSTGLLSPEKFESLIQFKYLRSLAQPGEAVGLLAAQVYCCVGSLSGGLGYQTTVYA